MDADLLKEIPSAAHYKSELESMERENSELKTKIQILESQEINLRQEIQRRDDIIEKQKSNAHDNRLDDIEKKILAYLIGGMKPENEVIDEMGIKPEVLRFHLENLSKLMLIEVKNVGGFYTSCTLLQDGRAYLIKNELV